MRYQFARIASDRNISFLSQMPGFWHLDSAEEDPLRTAGSLWIRKESFLHPLGERAHGRGQWNTTSKVPTPVLAPLGIALWSIRYAVGGRSRSKRYSTGQISPGGVTSRSRPPILVVDNIPQGEICHLQSHRACSLDWICEDLDISFGLGY